MIEILHKDLLARRARFQTKTSTVETPAFIPVVHPTRELISPRRMYDEFDCKIIITNAYLLSKSGVEKSVHDVLGYPGTIMTDSGAYQLLIYGDVDTSPEQIIQFQETIGSDIAVILDVPTGGYASQEEAEKTVTETLLRARGSIAHRKDPDILWVGPIQGGTYPELVKQSALEISKLDYPIVAIGSPTQLMEQYQYDKLVDLIMAAKSNVPSNKPVHLFGAGHPMIFPLIVALGCDLFDSAAYALFAQQDRILTPEGTYRLEELHEQFCTCATCNKYTLTEIKQLSKSERTQVLAEHNLRICQHEIKRIKQAIIEGRLWRLIETRLNSHPSLVNAMHAVLKYQRTLEAFSPVTKKRAIFITSHWSLSQPEITRHYQRLSYYSPSPSNRNTLLLFSAPPTRPYQNSKEFRRFVQQYRVPSSKLTHNFEIVFISPFFGLVPFELNTFYPLAQNEVPQEVVSENQPFLAAQLIHYIRRHSQYIRILGLFASTNYWKTFIQLFEQELIPFKKPSSFYYTDFSNKSLKEFLTKIGE